MTELIEEARRTLPSLPFDDEGFAAFVAARSTELEPARVHAADLLLAYRASVGDPRALDVFERTFIPEVAKYLAGRGLSAAVVDEIRQRLRQHLFVAESGALPRISQYRGRGPLGAWVRMVTVRISLDITRRDRLTDEAELTPNAVHDPEIDLLKAADRAIFRRAFEESLRALSCEERNALRLYFLDGLTVTQIGELYHLHNSSVSRLIVRVRSLILVGMRQKLAAELSESEVERILQVAHSQIDLSISRLLKIA